MQKKKSFSCSRRYAEAPDDIFSVLMNADMKYPDIVLEDGTHLPLTNSTYISYMESPDRAVREGAFKTLYGQIASLKNTFAAIYRGYIKAGKILCTVKENIHQHVLCIWQIPMCLRAFTTTY